MKRDNVNYVVAGGFVLAAGIGLLVMLYAILGHQGATDPYHAYFASVSGIKHGTAVLYEGYRVGQVESIEPEHSGGHTRYRVNLSVQAGWPVRRGSVARVETAGLISAVSIDIAEGPGPGRLAPGSEIEGEGGVNLLAALSDVANDFRTLSRESLKPLAESLRATLDSVGGMSEAIALDARAIAEVVDPGTRARVRGTLEGLEQLVNELRVSNRALMDLLGEDNRARISSTLTRADRLAEELRSTNASLQGFLDEENRAHVKVALGSVGRVASSLEKVAGTVEDVVSEKNKRNLERTLANLEGATRDMGGLVRSLDATRGRLDAALDTVNRLLDANGKNVTVAVEDLRRTLAVIASHVGTVSHHLEGTSRNLHEFARQIRENPSLLVRASPQQDLGRSSR